MCTMYSTSCNSFAYHFQDEPMATDHEGIQDDDDDNLQHDSDEDGEDDGEPIIVKVEFSTNEEEEPIINTFPMFKSFVNYLPQLSNAELSSMTNLPVNLRLEIRTGIPELNPANRKDLFPAYFAYRMGKIRGTCHPL